MSEPVGIVLVSHSKRLVEGLRELLRQLGGEDVPIAVAGGTEDGRLGTSHDLVVAAIGEADRGGGVAVFADLGSSVLTARLVLDDQRRADVLLVDAPLVEGAVSATVTAAAGADLSAVVAAGEEARTSRKLAD